MKVIRIVTYEGSMEQLQTQMEHSLKDGECGFVSPVKITIQTIHTDVESWKFGVDRPEMPIEKM